ncbi:hypothetical protein HELRODRAFT_176469 [Helobdella robusta]|uniref:Fibrinogen C-terminal domain-containing protein n=2 Tax=Helobdella robusta TaxID=6412 RepID=T1FAJ4_HELRO|nr:hypothetical protein HELRODRAFT_176469 [Helobdella robusta]ESN99709.1 hypothetical protein HELRODRAFT_176469 [Helobdella robusta]
MAQIAVCERVKINQMLTKNLVLDFSLVIRFRWNTQFKNSSNLFFGVVPRRKQCNMAFMLCWRNLCGKWDATNGNSSANVTFQNPIDEVVPHLLIIKCAWMCETSVALPCVGFNFRWNKTNSTENVLCQFFSYTPQLYLSEDLCVFYGVMQRRMDGSENFYRNWTDYERGFGDSRKEFWIGNDNIHRITSNQKYKVLFVLEDFEGKVACAAYDSFSVGSPDTYYVLNIGKYSGTAGDSMANHSFTTYDSDHDTYGYNCAQVYQGAWWYYACWTACLNGRYFKAGQSSNANGVNWQTFRSYYSSLKFTEMRVESV